MSPQLQAAIIAGGVGILTVLAQIIGFRSTRTNTERQIEQQGKQLDRTLAEQLTRTLNERFATAAAQLGSDKSAVRLAGVYAMAGLADDWEKNRQTCVDVLCAYLRMPYEPDPGERAPVEKRLAFSASREVRHTVIRVVTAHLKDGAVVSWSGLNFDFTGVVFDGADFGEAEFCDGTVLFDGAEFSGNVSFYHAKFSGDVSFVDAKFSGDVSFVGIRFEGGELYFSGAQFAGTVAFGFAQFSRGIGYLIGAEFSGEVTFDFAQFSGGTVQFDDGVFSGMTSFSGTVFSGGKVRFGNAAFPGGKVDFSGAQFSGSDVNFTRGQFSGGDVDFTRAHFTGGGVDFSDPRDWSIPPRFPWTGLPALGVKLPKEADQS